METSTLNSRSFVAAAIIFAALVIGGVALALMALVVAGAVQQGILIGLGSALVAGGLAFILVEAFAQTVSRRPRTNARE
jgi:zinc transporter ZupT